MTTFSEVLLAVLGLTGLVVVIPLAFWAWCDRRPQGPDVGLAVFVEDPTGDYDDDCGPLPPTEAEWKAMNDEYFPGVEDDDEKWEPPLVQYGAHMVHGLCLKFRRDGRPPCPDCARVMDGAAV